MTLHLIQPPYSRMVKCEMQKLKQPSRMISKWWHHAEMLRRMLWQYCWMDVLCYEQYHGRHQAQCKITYASSVVVSSDCWRRLMYILSLTGTNLRAQKKVQGKNETREQAGYTLCDALQVCHLKKPR